MHVSKCSDTVTVEIDAFIFFRGGWFHINGFTIENKFCFLQLISYNKKKAKTLYTPTYQ